MEQKGHHYLPLAQDMKGDQPEGTKPQKEKIKILLGPSVYQ